MVFTVRQIRAIVSEISYLDWNIVIRMDNERPYLQIRGHGPDPKKGMVDAIWTSRKWWLSLHMCKNEIIRAAYKAIQCAVAHELDETFMYRGVAVMTPHIDYDVLVTMMQDRNIINARINGMQGE